MGVFDQSEFEVRCEWGLDGLTRLAPISDVVIVVDVLSFSTAVDIGTGRGALLFPYPLRDASASAYAESAGAELASSQRDGGFSLSPSSLENISRGHRLILPSPNGSALCFAAQGSRCQAPHLLTACLRNASAAARVASTLGATFGVILAGETWPSGQVRLGLEDLIGAGSVIARLPGKKSPEAQLALAPFEQLRAGLYPALESCGSGKELIERGFARDVELAAQYDVSGNAPVLTGRAFVQS